MTAANEADLANELKIPYALVFIFNIQYFIFRFAWLTIVQMV